MPRRLYVVVIVTALLAVAVPERADPVSARAADWDVHRSATPCAAAERPDVDAPWRDRATLVRPVILVPSDLRGPVAITLTGPLCSALTDLQAWFTGATGRHGAAATFRFQEPVRIDSDRTSAWFACHGLATCAGTVVWDNVLADLAAKGFAWFDPTRVTVAVMPGAGGFNGGAAVGTAGAGVAVLGDQTVQGFLGTCDRATWWCSYDGGVPREQQTGALAHELGHAFGLTHPARACAAGATCERVDPFQASVMGAWWNWPARGALADGGLAASEADALRVHPAFTAVDETDGVVALPESTRAAAREPGLVARLAAPVLSLFAPEQP